MNLEEGNENVNPDEEYEDDDEIYRVQHIEANAYQIAILNKMLPKGFKFDLHELVKKSQELHSKKTNCLANY